MEPKELIDISRDWLTTKRISTELQFLARPLAGRPISQHERPDGEDFVLQEEDGVRLFVAFSAQGEPVGFVIFDPIYRYGQVESYTASILRCRKYYSPDNGHSRMRVPSGLIDAILLEAIEHFRHEGIRSLSLGLMPFARNDSDGVSSFHANRLTTLLFDGLYSFGSPLFNFRSLSWHKRRYHGREEPVYFSAPQKVAQLWHLHQANAMMGFRYGQALRNALLGSH